MESPLRHTGVLACAAMDQRMTAAVGLPAPSVWRTRKAVTPLVAARKESRRLSVKP
jgi:hypothetical protein